MFIGVCSIIQLEKLNFSLTVGLTVLSIFLCVKINKNEEGHDYNKCMEKIYYGYVEEHREKSVFESADGTLLTE